MKKNTRIPAFTLIELVVTMAIGGIVILVGGTAWRINHQQLNNFQSNSEQLLEISQLNHLLHLDFSRAVYVQKKLHGLEFRMRSSVTTYEFGASTMVRTVPGLTDSFLVTAFDVQTNWQQRPASKFVDELIFYIQEGEKILPFHFSKIYAADQIINANSSAL